MKDEGPVPMDVDISDLEDVIFHTRYNLPPRNEAPVVTARFRTSTSELNTLAMTKLLHGADDMKNLDRVNANGTWDSIVAYGRLSKLDDEQQIAFEILAATYVLTFYDEAEENLLNNEDKDAFIAQKERLMQLARRQSLLRHF